MKFFLILALLLAVSNVASAAGCGFKPFPPFGCDRDSARCYCDSDGNCTWIWDCG